MWRVLKLFVLLSAGAADEAPWRQLSDEGGVSLEVQAVPGSGYETIRVRCATTASPRTFIRALWGVASDRSASPEVVHRDVLIDQAQVRRYHDVVRAPPASDRDYVMHETWAEDEGSGTVTMRFEAVDDERAPRRESWVRFGRVSGSVSATPRPDGGSILTYVVFTDLGGSIPAWLTLGPQRSAAKAFLLEIRRRAERAP